jgi:hypothetical protein
LTSWQSFVGVLAASFCSAIIFAKVAKYQSVAHVAFSQTAIIRYGQELLDDTLLRSMSTTNLGHDWKESVRNILGSETMKKIEKFPCPILEFRVVNLLHREKGGEIMNCGINVVASNLEEVTTKDCIDALANDSDLSSKRRRRSMTKGVKKIARSIAKTAKDRVNTSGKIGNRGSILQRVNRSITEFATSYYSSDQNSLSSHEDEGEPFKEDGSYSLRDQEFECSVDRDNPVDHGNPRKVKETKKNSKKKRKKEQSKKADLYGASTESIFVDEEAYEGEGKRRVFSRLEMETDSHPFFKRVWNMRHILNEESPVLNLDARRLIRMNKGMWPASMCNAEAIKSCLDMSQLIVTMSGTAVVSGSSVYKLHVYELEQIEIGRIFENPLALGNDGKLTVDFSLISATKPQLQEEAEEQSHSESINLEIVDRSRSRFTPRRFSLSTRMGF